MLQPAKSRGFGSVIFVGPTWTDAQRPGGPCGADAVAGTRAASRALDCVAAAVSVAAVVPGQPRLLQVRATKPQAAVARCGAQHSEPIMHGVQAAATPCEPPAWQPDAAEWPPLALVPPVRPPFLSWCKGLAFALSSYPGALGILSALRSACICPWPLELIPVHLDL